MTYPNSATNALIQVFVNSHLDALKSVMGLQSPSCPVPPAPPIQSPEWPYHPPHAGRFNGSPRYGQNLYSSTGHTQLSIITLPLQPSNCYSLPHILCPDHMELHGFQLRQTDRQTTTHTHIHHAELIRIVFFLKALETWRNSRHVVLFRLTSRHQAIISPSVLHATNNPNCDC